jgi:SAM-dependent methyltransferase
MPFETGSMDAVYAIESLCHCTSKPEFIAEAARVLRPGGRLVIFDLFVSEDALSDGERKRLAIVMDGWCLPNLLKLSEYTQAAHAAGLGEIAFSDALDYVSPDTERMARQCRLAMPHTYYRVWKGTLSRVVLGSRRAGKHAHRLLQDRNVTYGIFTATRVERSCKT